jgi:hypothetical protein
MGQFKPMVKMMTTEPSVILKLKKGGNVHSKMATGGMAGHKAMHCEPADFEAAEHGKAPKKPSMADRRKAMNPNQYAKGGKVAHKQMGGMMPGAMPAAPAAPMAGGMAGGMRSPMSAMSPTALAAMPASARMSRAAKVRRALTGMKKGGSTSADCAKLEKELKHHESMSASKAHGMASGGSASYAKTKMVSGDKHDKAHGTGAVKNGKPGGYKMGGTIEGNEAEYAKTKVVDGDKTDRAHGTKGVRMSNAGGFAKGGNVDWENRPANTAKPGVSNTTTGGVKNGNGGGFKMGGLAAKKAYATGGTVDTGKPVAMPRKPASRPVANTMQSGTFKKGGNVKKFSEGDAVIDSETRRMQTEKDVQKRENQAMRESILGAPKRMYEGVKGLFASKPEVPAGSVTKTEKSVTVTPKRRGGRAMC